MDYTESGVTFPHALGAIFTHQRGGVAMTDDVVNTEESTEQPTSGSLVKRRTFLKKGAVAGIGVAALYMTPQFSSVYAKPAYAGITGAGVVITKRFGSLPETEFGGDGISNHAVAVTDITGLPGGKSITLGLAATERFSAPAVTNNGAGVFTAQSGVDGGGVRGLWNFSYFMKIVGGTFADYKFCLLYDFNPGVGTSEASLGKFDFNAAIALPGPPDLASTTLIEDSQNLTFGFLAGIPVYPFITPPSFTPFSAFVNGEYSFELLAKTNADVEVGRTSIKVNVVSPPG